MRDPYRPPDTEVEGAPTPYKPERVWRLVLLMFLPFSLLQYIALTRSGYAMLADPALVIDTLVTVVFYIGLFGLAFAKTLGPALFWRGFLVVMIASDSWQIAFALLELDTGPGANDPRAGWSIGLPVALFAAVQMVCWYAIFQYQRLLANGWQH
jgi:hypothetical protein